MGQPWGMSGWQFISLYLAGMVAAVAILLWLRRAIAHGSQRAGHELVPCAVGYLAKGASRAAEVVIVGHVESGALRADSSGGLMIAGDWELAIAGKGGPGIPDDPAGRAALARIAAAGGTLGGLRTGEVRRIVAALPSVRSIRKELCAAGLLVPGRRRLVPPLAAAAMVLALQAAGLLRIEAGHLDRRQVDCLTVLTTVALMGGYLAVVLLALCGPRITRPGGAVCLGRAAQQAAAAGGSALLPVALAGFGAVRDKATRTALEAGMPEPAHSACGGCGGCGGGCGG